MSKALEKASKVVQVTFNRLTVDIEDKAAIVMAETFFLSAIHDLETTGMTSSARLALETDPKSLADGFYPRTQDDFIEIHRRVVERYSSPTSGTNHRQPGMAA